MTPELVILLSTLETMARYEKTDVVITGIQGEDYPKGRSHQLGYAVDVRTKGIENPRVFARRLSSVLGIYNPKDVKVLYGDPQHLDHIHVGIKL